MKASLPAGLTADQLRHRLDPASLPFATTADVEPLSTTVGQPRAFDAISFGIQTEAKGFNLYVAGAPGSGRESTVRDYVAAFASTRPTPFDWLYVHDFAQVDRPAAISLPAGKGRVFAKDIADLRASLVTDIPRAFESEEVQRRRDAVITAIAEQKSTLLTATQAFAKDHDFLLEMTPTGVLSYATLDGKPIEKEGFELLPDARKRQIEINGAAVQERVSVMLRQFRQLDKAVAEQLAGLERDVVKFATAHRFEELRARYAAHEHVLRFLAQIEEAVLAQLHDFWPAQPVDGAGAPEIQMAQRAERLARFDVNLLIDNGDLTGAPVVFERNPTFANLIGRIDYRAVFGSMVTDYRQIKPGALHRANGGFLILQIADVLRNPFAWETLKRALECSEIEIENLADQIAAIPTARLRPATIPLQVKVVLIGAPSLYPLLYHLDEDFPELFSVKADFAPDMPWSEEHTMDYAAFVSRHVREHGLRHLDRGAVARVVEEGARLREHQRKLSTRFLDIANLITEASHWAGVAGSEIVRAEDVDKAVRQRIYRASLIEERLQEMITDGTIQIATTGERVGQVNGLAVLNSGDYAFGKPSRVSARVAIGKGTIQSIEREIELSGPIHSKGFLILSGYLQGQYGAAAPLALSATITFEQAYEGIDGDSASSTELYALLSALSGVPLRQHIAVTGSVNQYGEIQAVGGVTQKVEGFFGLCKARGLTGDQGVMIPATNVAHLMLSPDVVEAVRAGLFHVWPVATIDEGIELLTGVSAGAKNDAGNYPARSIHRLVSDRLRGFLEQAIALNAPGQTPAMDGKGRKQTGVAPG